MKSRKSVFRYLMVIPPVVAALLAVQGINVSAQTGPDPQSAEVALANVVDQHTHSIVLQAQDVANLIANLQDGESVQLESSTGFDGGPLNGIPHTHTVTLTRQDLQTLQSTGTLSVVSDMALGHRHTFTFIMQQNCPAIATPLPSPSVSPSVSPSPSASPSASPSPSPSTSPTTSPTPSITPTTTPSGSPGPIVTLRPIPLPTVTGIASPLAGP